ncbi:MAG: hypothetical protein LLG06_02860 [Desulfobacteraceae bacterium]|nr:hypothetical protein [Desulfobacteraceae bacterium]
MSSRIRIRSGGVVLEAELSDTPTGNAIRDALPLTAGANTWGDEIYFAVPVSRGLDSTAAETVDVGDIGYWPTGRAFCIFFGPTPMSRGDEIRPASAVNIVGKVLGDARALRSVRNGDLMELEVIS